MDRNMPLYQRGQEAESPLPTLGCSEVPTCIFQVVEVHRHRTGNKRKKAPMTPSTGSLAKRKVPGGLPHFQNLHPEGTLSDRIQESSSPVSLMEEESTSLKAEGKKIDHSGGPRAQSILSHAGRSLTPGPAPQRQYLVTPFIAATRDGGAGTCWRQAPDLASGMRVEVEVSLAWTTESEGGGGCRLGLLGLSEEKGPGDQESCFLNSVFPAPAEEAVPLWQPQRLTQDPWLVPFSQPCCSYCCPSHRNLLDKKVRTSMAVLTLTLGLTIPHLPSPGPPLSKEPLRASPAAASSHGDTTHGLWPLPSCSLLTPGLWVPSRLLPALRVSPIRCWGGLQTSCCPGFLSRLPPSLSISVCICLCPVLRACLCPSPRLSVCVSFSITVSGKSSNMASALP
ncbi:LOW QUALITY PROTEIN: hypothetical protein QTO34_010075 [Cnephaeus nilssonii]|uniref:Uncharacterized protein n=1 Tax=Cnephaeus nilssonii TaxID=3371016 RepID=A0AA40HFJ5_CNENI|nr:LOW QUALITY PROTEIN: hypothetical protein QTO34_010075 [Eptesicus nilssonii]